MDLEEDKVVNRFALSPGPLVHIISITVHPNTKEHGTFTIYGNINAEFWDSVHGRMVDVDIYTRQRDDPELIDSSCALTLNGPKFSINPDEAFVPMSRARIYVKLFDETDNIFMQESFTLEDNDMGGCYEQVKFMSICSEQGSLTLRYVAIPLGINCRLDVLFCNKPNYAKQDPVNVNGNISARFVNTYGNYNSEECECFLFKKRPSEFERVEVDGAEMQLTRSWVTLPAYASLVIGFDLSEFQTKRKIVNETVEFLAQPGMLFGKTLMLDNMVILVKVAWFSSKFLGAVRNKSLPSLQEIPVEESDEMDTDIEGEDEDEDEMDSDIEGEDEFFSDEESSSNLDITRDLRAHKNKPAISEAVEIFSVVVISQDNSKEIQIHGSIELLSNDEKVCYIFKRDANDALRLTQDTRSSLILDGSRKYDDCSTLELRFDIKDVDNHIVIKGFKEWGESKLEYWRDQQLCCFVQGNNGFAAVHYSIFPRAVAAVIKISVNLKAGLSLDLGRYGIYGSIISQYRDFDYSSRYNKDYYRVVLFEKIRDKAIQLGLDGSIPLSRSMLVVPSYTSLIINLDLSIGASGLNLSYVKEIEIGEDCKTIETNELLLRIHVDWCVIK